MRFRHAPLLALLCPWPSWAASPPLPPDDGPPTFLTDIEGGQALDWVQQHNDRSFGVCRAVASRGLSRSPWVWLKVCDAAAGFLDSGLRLGSVSALISHENRQRVVAWFGRQDFLNQQDRQWLDRSCGFVR